MTHLDRIWITAPILVIPLTLVGSLRSGKILNASGANPMIADRVENAVAYRFQFASRIHMSSLVIDERSFRRHLENIANQGVC